MLRRQIRDGVKVIRVLLRHDSELLHGLVDLPVPLGQLFPVLRLLLLQRLAEILRALALADAVQEVKIDYLSELQHLHVLGLLLEFDYFLLLALLAPLQLHVLLPEFLLLPLESGLLLDEVLHSASETLKSAP